MEDGKRKKRNKKNKGKPAKTVDNVTVGSEESMQEVPETNHASAPEQNHQEPDMGIADDQSGGKRTATVDNVTLSSEEPIQTEREVNHESASEQNYQEQDTGILGAQNVSVRDPERELERHKVMESNFADLQETIKALQNNIISCIEKEARLEKKIELLQNESEFFEKKEISWNLKFEQLQSVIHSCSAKENLIGETVDKLKEANAGLQMQVEQLERSRDNLVQENQQLTNSISLLEARVQHLENEAASFRSSTRTMTQHISYDKDTEKQVEPVSEQVEPVSEPSEKVVIVEPELVGKVNQQNGIIEHSPMFSVSSSEPDANAVRATYLLPDEEIISESTYEFSSPGTFETIRITDANVNDIADATVHPEELPLLDELNGSAEIVQVPLDDNQVQEVEAQYLNEENKVVSFSDAPLIGAPFRIMSFFAKYVSGADLVKENRRNSG